MRGTEFVFDSVDLLHYKLRKTSLNRRRWYLDFPKFLKNKKVTIYLNNNDDTCFQYALSAELNYKQIKSHPKRISNIKPFIDQYNWKEISFQSYQKDWKTFDLNNKSVALNISFAILKK